MIASLDGKSQVWQASYQAFTQRPIIGYGYIIGVKNALHDQWLYSHWTPPSAHNEFLQALLSGGISALVLVVAIYEVTLWTALRNSKGGPGPILLLVILAQLTTKALVATVMSTFFSSVGAIFLICFIAVVAGANRRRAPARSRSFVTLEPSPNHTT